MLGFLFGFNARLGRLHFVLGIIAVAVAGVATDLALSPYTIQQLASGAKPPANPFAWPLIFPTLGFLWIKLTLESMRIRGQMHRHCPRPAQREQPGQDSAAGHSRHCERSHLLERQVDLAVLFQPLRHRQVFRAHELRIEQS